MKKIFCFLVIGAMVLTSCSSSDDGGNAAVLLKTMVRTSTGGTVTTQTATYDGAKISTITGSDGNVSYFTYSGDLITKREYKSGTTLLITESFTYDSNQRLTTYLRLLHDIDVGRRETYTHADDGTVYVSMYDGDLESQEDVLGYAVLTFLENGEIGTVDDTGEVRNYTYDNKNNPFRNITGYGKISWVLAMPQGISHNITSDSVEGFPVSTSTTYTYNGDGYPTEAVKTYSGGGEATTEFIYY